ncbi:MAG: NAD(P)-dependent oxidoreductase [Rhodospirillaceae bacterium]|nr:NAD(P)-dependent oxidoreductase [Rhodospirillaceae bacterium]
MKISFVGIGAIGLPMAQRIAMKGYDVIGVDPMPAARAKAEEIGLPAVAAITEISGADIVVVMVATPQQLEALVDMALEGKVAGQIWVVMSTAGADAVSRCGEKLRAAGARVVDAPVTGGTARARTGELAIFASGNKADIADVRAILECTGVVHEVGPRLGDGQGIKIINQHLCSIHIVAAAEALNLAGSLGLDRAFVLDLVKRGAGGSWMLSDRGPRMVMEGEPPVTSTINIFVKDSSLVAAMAESCGADVPLLDVARARYQDAAAAGLTLSDDSTVIRTYAKKAR